MMNEQPFRDLATIYMSLAFLGMALPGLEFKDAWKKLKKLSDNFGVWEISWLQYH